MFTAIEALLLWLVLQAAATDLALRRIPNVLVLSGLLLALALHGLAGGPGALLSAWLAGALAGLLLFLPLYLLRGMAAGDVKLMAMVGAFTGPAQALDVALLSFAAGGALALLQLAATGGLPGAAAGAARTLYRTLLRLSGVPLAPVPLQLHRAGRATGGMPFGVAVAAGTLGVVLAPHFRAAA